MAIDVLFTGTVVSESREFIQKGQRHVKVTLEARDAKGDRVNIVASTANERLAGNLELLEIGQAAAIRGHVAVPSNVRKAEGRTELRLYVSVTGVIALNS